MKSRECWHVAQGMQGVWWSRPPKSNHRPVIDFPSNGSDLCMANRSIECRLCRRESIDGRRTWRPLPCGICCVEYASENGQKNLQRQARRRQRWQSIERGEALWAAVSWRPFLSLAATHPSIRNSSYLHPPNTLLQSLHQLLLPDSLRRRRRELEPSKDLWGSEALNTRPITLENHFLDPLTTGAFFLERRTAGTDDDEDCLLNGFLSTVCALTSLCSIATGQHSLRWRSVGCD